MQRSKTSKSRTGSGSKNTSSSKKSRRSSRRKRAADSKGASLSTASPVPDPAGSGSSAADAVASGAPAVSSVSGSVKEAEASDNSGFFGFNPAETSGLDDFENIPLDPSNLDLWFLPDTAPLAAGSENGPDPSLFEEEKPAPAPADDFSGESEQESGQKKTDMPEPGPADDTAETPGGKPASQSGESVFVSDRTEDIPEDHYKRDSKLTSDDQLEKALQNHDNDQSEKTLLNHDNDQSEKTLLNHDNDQSEKALQNRDNDQSEEALQNYHNDQTADSEDRPSVFSSRGKPDTSSAALAGLSAAASARRRSYTTAAASSVPDMAFSDEDNYDSVSRRTHIESPADDFNQNSAPFNHRPEELPEHRRGSDVSEKHSSFREGESLSDDRLPLHFVLIKILFTLIGIIFCLMIVTYFRARLAGEVPNLGILTQLLEKHQKEVEITGSSDGSPNMGPGFDITTGFYGKSIDLFNQSDSAEDDSADTAGQDQAEQTDGQTQSSTDPATGNGESSQTQSAGQAVPAAPQETALPETVQQDPAIDNGAADQNPVQQGAGYDNGSGDQAVDVPPGTETQTEEIYYDESGQPIANPEQTFDNGTGDGQGTIVEETIIEDDGGSDLDGYYDEGDGYYDDDGYYYEEVPEDEDGEYYEEDEDYDEDEDE